MSPPSKHFSKSTLDSLHKSKILGIRAGKEHRFTGIWVVVVKHRVFVRSWNNKKSGWYASFLQNPIGKISLSEREIAVRAKRVRGERLFDTIDQAYGEKYNTPGSQKYVRGFALASRRNTTLELIPK